MSIPGDSDPATAHPLPQAEQRSPLLRLQEPIQLGYITSDVTGGVRPSIVVALGITSIIIAALQGLMALSTTISSIAALVTGGRTTASVATSTILTTTAPTTVPASGPTTVPGLTPAQVSAMLNPPGTEPLRYAVLMLACGSMALSVLLVVAGIQTLLARRAGRRLHLWWVAIKLPLEIAAILASTLIMVQMFSVVSVAMAGPSTSGGFTQTSWFFTPAAIVYGAIQLFFSAAYPIAVWIVLTRRNVKAYFATVH